MHHPAGPRLPPAPTSVTPRAASPALRELNTLVDSLLGALPQSSTSTTLKSIQSQCDCLRRIRQLLIDSPDSRQVKDAFRQAKGFHALIATLRSVSGFYNPSALSKDEQTEFFELLKAVLAVLSDALNDHTGNRRFFTKRVEDDGWKSLEQSVVSTGVGGGYQDATVYDHVGQEQLFGCLVAFALGEENMARVFRGIRDVVASEYNGVEQAEHNGDVVHVTSEDPLISALREHLNGFFSGNEILQNAEIFPVIVSLWLMLFEDGLSGSRAPRLSISILLVLNHVIALSEHNKLAAHGTGVLKTLLRLLFENPQDSLERVLLKRLAQSLISYGINDLEDARFLFRGAAESEEVATFLLEAMRSSRQSPFIQLDMSLHGYASIELPELGRPFPPASQHGGYTISTWLRVDKYDDNYHTTIFGAYDTTQTCFVLVYLEKVSRNLILQTSVTSSRPSIRFKSTVFQQGAWYHVAIVHRRSKTVGPGRAALYVNGEFTEQMKCNFPSSPPNLNSSSTESFNAFSQNRLGHTPIEAFIGTPHAFCSHIGRNIVSTKLSLASFHLFQEALSDELIAVYHKLGPRYHGNFQDCLGSFLTYNASADLNLYNEGLHPTKDERSEILSAMRNKAGAILPESRILMSIAPTSVMDDDDKNFIDESTLVKSLSKHAGRNLREYTRNRGHAIAINAAVPSINDALTQRSGVAVLTGEPVVVVPQSLDNAIWRIGGCASIGLKLIELARTRNALVTAVQIMFESVHENWRNSEAMERENGFAVLAALLRDKLGLGFISGKSSAAAIEDPDFESLSYELLQVVLRFIGYDEIQTQESKIVNPLAYRALLIDFDLWRRCPADTQKLYYRQFEVFAKESKYHVFNAKRLTRMRIIKRLLEALKGETFTNDVFPHFMSAFKSLLQCSASSDILRSTALFITYALQESRNLVNRPLRSRSSVKHMHNITPTLSSASSTSSVLVPSKSSLPTGKLSRQELGIKVLEAYAAFLCDDASANAIGRFAKTVTNKWLVYLLAESDARVIVNSFKILARLLVIQGPHFVKKFTRDGGFTNLKHRLRSSWNTPAVWTICFAILFGVDVGKINFERDFDLFNLMDSLSANGQIAISYPDIFPVMTAMLETGLREIVTQQEPGVRPATSQGDVESGAKQSGPSPGGLTRKRSMSVENELAAREPKQPSSRQKVLDYAAILHTIIQFLADVHMKSAHFREYAIASNYIQDLIFVLYPVIVTSDGVSAETELHSRGSALTFEGQDVLINPHSATAEQPSIVRTTSIEPPRSPSAKKATLRRGNSFILITSDKAKYPSAAARLHGIMSPKKSASVDLRVGNAVVQALLELIIGVFLDQLLHKKDFSGFGLFLKVPPGFQEHQAYFESYVLLHTMQAITTELQLRQELLAEPRVLTNLARYTLHMAEAIFEGWFMNGAEALLDFIGTVLDHLHRPDIAKLKGVRLCTQAIATVRTVFFRVALLRLSELDDPESEAEAISFLQKMTYWQTIILSPENLEGNYLRLICYLLYAKLVSPNSRVRAAAADFWRLMLVQKPDETSQILNQSNSNSDKELFADFMKLTEMDNDAFFQWLDSNRSKLDNFFFGAMSKTWEEFVTEENRKTEDSAKTRISKRKERLRQWQMEESAADIVWHRHEVSTTHWRANIFAAERLKHQRALQDQQDNLTFLSSALEKLDRTLRAPCALFEDEVVSQWQLDETEGRNRMRLRIIPDKTTNKDEEYQPKRKESEFVPKNRLSLLTNVPQIDSPETAGPTPASAHPTSNNGEGGRNRSVSQSSGVSNGDDDFELVSNPNEGEDGFEDKNRKVMRSLEQGDQVQHVYNVSRIVGLEACEGLLILGKDSLYLMDDFFQRSDGEIIRVWQAPPEERDSYVQMISGKKATEKRSPRINGEQSTRHWKWSEVISISKRRFLFRDVAIEIFFTDGRSYLLTAMAPKLRDDLHARLISRAPQVTSPSALQSEDAWRLESLRTPEEAPPTMAAKWVNAFNPMAQNPATKKWLKGDISNFHYLMLVNTMAGRTFNDLTQYPVFPWVLADYTSEELDLSDPKTFRDLSKPMGAQTPTREAEFKERYQTFLEMSDGTNPVFHYGTHYSSAMIVTSYLIRLQPFVQSYLLLQGGSFDHADRLFDSIERAWNSASRDNTTDVRELTPEFFYLPEFLKNLNGYNFGVKQGSGERINDVVLPPWAKGDPEIFIAKHREALESPFVTQNLHKWIDLVFGYKQQGDAAIEATNVFHYLSYHGAKNLDLIDDPVERLATIGIIHNFGQTPHQVFQKAHPSRGDSSRSKRLDSAADCLIRLPMTLLDSRERVASLTHHPKQDRILCSAALRINVPPSYDRYMEWGFTDGSVRFYSTDSKRLIGLWEHLHQGQISCATFVDGKTLITAGSDCTVAVWNVVSHSKTVDLVPKVCFFGHRKPVTVIATSRAFSTFLSADSSGRICLWDLNRAEFVRHVGAGDRPIQCARINNVNGHIALCAGSKVLLYTLNGRLLLEQDVCDTADAEDIVHACAFYEGVGNEWLERELLFTGHRRGVVNIWAVAYDADGLWSLRAVKRLNHIDTTREDGINVSAPITYVLPMAQMAYTGDDDGKVVSWQENHDYLLPHVHDPVS